MGFVQDKKEYLIDRKLGNVHWKKKSRRNETLHITIASFPSKPIAIFKNNLEKIAQSKRKKQSLVSINSHY